MEWKFKKNEKLNKVILMVLVGVLLLILVMPAQNSDTASSGVAEDTEQAASSYEDRLRTLLSDAYGEGMVDVLIYSQPKTDGYYDMKQKEEITGVLITIRESAVSETTISDITLAVCALFDLPAHKVAVLVKK